VSVGSFAVGLGSAVAGYASSGLPGPKGNQETFVWLCEPARGTSVGDIEAAALTVEP
jgi:23S rRNA (cytidine1920-2'-O)/16S rRNA (cytidine1409-2'-O)-methyltransferase